MRRTHPQPSWPATFVLLALAAVVAWTWSAQVASEAVRQAGPATASMTSPAAVWPILGLGADDGEGLVIGAPERMQIPAEGSQWTSPGPMKQSGFVVAWARVKGDYAATATGSISKDGSTWIDVMRASVNANRSMPDVNVVVPVPEGYHFRLELAGARGGGLEIIEASGGHWFPLGPASD